jgi:signal transduction histidine kinase
MVLITNMLETERARLTGAHIDHIPTEIIGLVRDCVEGHRAQAELGNLVLSIHASLAEVWTRTDPVRVRQILDNLLSNAVKFTNAGGIAIDVRIKAKPGADSRRTIEIAVSDTGPGIAAADHERIFEEFERAGPKKVPGQGIGLAMSRILAHVVGGEITVESDPQAGSTFTLWLPLDPPSTSEHPTVPLGLMEPPSQAAS